MCTDAWKKVQMFVKSVENIWGRPFWCWEYRGGEWWGLKKSEQSDKTDWKTKSEGHRKRDFSSKSFCYLFLEACAGRQEGCRYVWRVWETFWDPGNLEASLVSLPPNKWLWSLRQTFWRPQTHGAVHENHTGEKPFVCTVCGKAFTQNGNLMGRDRVFAACVVGALALKNTWRLTWESIRRRSCFCAGSAGKSLGKGALWKHMKIHTAGSTYQSVICDKKLYKPDALKIHMRSHTGEKLYLCEKLHLPNTWVSTKESWHVPWENIPEERRTEKTSNNSRGWIHPADRSIKIFKAEIRYYLLIQTVRLHQSGLTVRFHLSIKANMHSFRD